MYPDEEALKRRQERLTFGRTIAIEEIPAEFEMVHRFMDKFGVPKVGTYENIVLQYSLLLEEVVEMGNALGLLETGEDKVFVNDTYLYYIFGNAVRKELEKNGIKPIPDVGSIEFKEDILDAAIDINYFVPQILAQCKLLGCYKPGFRAVTDANFAKMVDGKVVRSDGTDGNPVGKILKPKDWKPADLKEIIKEYSDL